MAYRPVEKEPTLSVADAERGILNLEHRVANGAWPLAVGLISFGVGVALCGSAAETDSETARGAYGFAAFWFLVFGLIAVIYAALVFSISAGIADRKVPLPSSLTPKGAMGRPMRDLSN